MYTNWSPHLRDLKKPTGIHLVQLKTTITYICLLIAFKLCTLRFNTLAKETLHLAHNPIACI